MTSNDSNVFIREDVFNARMDALMSQIRLENEKLRNELNSKIDSVQSGLNSKIDERFGVVQTQIGQLQSQISVLDSRMNGFDARLNDLQNNVSWSFTIIAVFVAVLGVLTGIIVALAPSIWTFFKRSQERATANQPPLTEEKVQELIAKAFNNSGYIGK